MSGRIVAQHIADGIVLSTANIYFTPTTTLAQGSSGRRSPQPLVRRPSFATKRIAVRGHRVRKG